ncbi:hypothetical protein K0M31_011002 [Melipona bicolor]|uniref:Uncharacterized protein n=1 Tax=Melipona bicolor TaxID=60889 RepID=A0AA40FL35_9HYME|nr:hypothetical protein K0M31_011002 [Melipona bicolor]
MKSKSAGKRKPVRDVIQRRRIEEETEGKKKTKKPMLSVPYKLINLGANNCLASFRESQIGGVDLAVFRGHAFSRPRYANVFAPIGRASEPLPP